MSGPIPRGVPSKRGLELVGAFVAVTAFIALAALAGVLAHVVLHG